MRNLEQRVQVKIKSIPKNNQRDNFFLYSGYVMYYKLGLKQYYYFCVCSNKYYYLLKKNKDVYPTLVVCVQCSLFITPIYNYKGQALLQLYFGQMLELRNIVQDQTQIKVGPIQPTAKMLYPLPKKLHVLVLYHLVVYIKERGLICATVEQITNV